MNWWTHASWSQATMVFFAVFILLWPLLEGVAYVHRRMRRQQNFIHARAPMSAAGETTAGARSRR